MTVGSSNSALMQIKQKLVALIGHRLFGSGVISLFIKVAGAGLSYVMLVAFAHLLSPDQYGVFAFSFNLAVVVGAFIGFGYSTAILRYWPKYLAQEKPDYAKGAVHMGAKLTALGAAIALAIGVGFDLLRLHSADTSTARNYLSVAALAITFCVGDFAAGVLRAQSSVVGAMLPRDVVWRVLAPLAAAAFVWFGFDLSSTSAVYICAGVLALLLVPQFALIGKGVREMTGAVEPHSDWAGTRSSLLPLWGAGIVFAMIQQMDVVVVGYLMNGADTGAYFAAQKTATLLSLVLIAGGLVTAPSMAALYEKGKTAELQKLCRQLVIAIAVATFLGFLFLVVTGNLLLSMFNSSFTSAYTILLILGFGCMIDAVAGPTAYLMQMTNYEKAYLKIMVVCYALVIAFQLVLIPRFGGLGAALASAGGTIIWNLWSIFLLRSKAGLDPSVFGLIFPVHSKRDV